MIFKTEKNFVRLAVAFWLACVAIDVAILSGGVYVIYHFVCKFW